MKKVLLCVLLLVAGGFALAPVATAEDEVQQAEPGWSYGLWNELMSPFCPGRTLADCPSGQAEELRIWIVDQEKQGREREAVLAELYEGFGDVLRQAPAARGIGLAAYVIPIVLFLAGGTLLGLFLRRQARKGGVVTAPPVTVVDPELQRALDEEIGS